MSEPGALPAQIGRYAVSQRLGVGAMGRVFLAHDPILDRDVAVKVLRDDLVIPDEQRGTLLDRMRQEARAAARVSHPNIVALHDMGEDDAVGLYLVFEYLRGDSLKDRLVRGSLGPVTAAGLAREIGDALATAHEAGVLHRDIKPENIILTRTGAKIADFGIARVPDSTLTLGGSLLGTPAYSAPEALSNGRFSDRSDQFSMAATMYEALSARRAFPGEDAMAVASQIRTEDPPPIARSIGADDRVDAILSRALSKSPGQRFESCETFGRMLAEALEEAPRTRMQTLPDEVHRRAALDHTSSRNARIAVGGAAVGALVAIAGFQLTAPLREPKPLPPPIPKGVSSAALMPTSRALPIAWLADLPAATEEKASPPARLRDDHSAQLSSAPPDAAAAQSTSSTAPDAGAVPRAHRKDGGPGGAR